MKGLKDKPCIKVNASRDTGPYSLFDIPADMIEAEFIMSARKANPKWQIYSEQAEPPCEANVFVDVKGLSYSLDRQQSFDTTHTTLGVGAGLSVYVPGAWEQPSLSVALSDSVPGVAKELVEGLEQDLRAAKSPQKPRSGAKQADEGKFCYSLATANRDRYEDLAQNFFHTSRNRTITNPDGYRPSENCIPDFYVSSNDIAIRSSSGIEGNYGALALRVPGETRSRIYLATGPGHSAALVSNINEMDRVLASLEQRAEKVRATSRSWTDNEIKSVLEAVVSTAKAYHTITSDITATNLKIQKIGVGITQNEQNERRRLQQELESLRVERYNIEKAGSEAIEKLHAALFSDAETVKRMAARWKGTTDFPESQLLSEMMLSFTDAERPGSHHSPFLQGAYDAWRKQR